MVHRECHRPRDNRSNHGEMQKFNNAGYLDDSARTKFSVQEISILINKNKLN